MTQLRGLFFASVLVFVLALSGCTGSTYTEDESGSPAEEAIPEGAFLVGANTAKLVPADSPMWFQDYDIYLGGFGMLKIRGSGTGKAQGVNDPPYVRSMVISQGSKTVAIAVIDATVIGNKIIRDIKERVSQNTGIPEWNVYIAATHSHSSLDLLGAYGGVSKEYRAFLIDKVAKSVINADSMKAPAKMYVSSVQYSPAKVKKDGEEIIIDGKPVTWIYNRRGWPDKENMYSNPDFDSTINVIEARDYITDKTIGVMVNFGSHPVLVTPDTYKFSRDYCGYLIDYVQKEVGAPAVFIQGTMGDINPGDWDQIGITADNCYGYAKSFGEDVAKKALDSMSNQTPVSNSMYVDQEPINDFSIDNPLMLLLLVLTSKSIEMEYDGSILKGIKGDTQVTYIRLGEEVQIAMLPGEAVTHMGLGVKKGEHAGLDGKQIAAFTGIKEVMTAPFKMVTSITGDTLIYLVPSEEWKNAPTDKEGEAGYEETMSMSLEGKLADSCRKAAINLIKMDK